MKVKTILIILTCTVTSCTIDQPNLSNELNKYILEVQSISPEHAFSDLNELKPLIASKNTVGLGEATHGTHEFFVYKHRLTKYLVKDGGFRVFIIEGDFAGSLTMNEYINNEKVAIGKALWDVGYGIWMTQEFAEFIEWMKTYNANQGANEKIRFYGCDFNNPFAAAKRIKEYLSKLNLASPNTRNGLDSIINRKYQDEFSKKDQISVNSLLQELDAAFDRKDGEFDSEYKLNKHCKRELEQYFELKSADRKTQIILRDKFMAENILWINSFERQQKSIFWAHNEHIKNDKAESDQKPTGYYLKKVMHDDYYSLGFSFYRGKVGGYNAGEKKYDSFEVPEMSSKKLLDAVFNECAFPQFILDVGSTGNNSQIQKFLNKELYQRTIGAGFYPDGKMRNHFRKGKLIDRFDGIIFFRDTNPVSVLGN